MRLQVSFTTSDYCKVETKLDIIGESQQTSGNSFKLRGDVPVCQTGERQASAGIPFGDGGVDTFLHYQVPGGEPIYNYATEDYQVVKISYKR